MPPLQLFGRSWHISSDGEQQGMHSSKTLPFPASALHQRAALHAHGCNCPSKSPTPLFPCTLPDLALPALVGVAFHGAWTALITAEVAAIGLPDDCERSQLASSSVLWLLISFALTTLLQCVVAGISMRGGLVEMQVLVKVVSTHLQTT